MMNLNIINPKYNKMINSSLKISLTTLATIKQIIKTTKRKYKLISHKKSIMRTWVKMNLNINNQKSNRMYN